MRFKLRAVAAVAAVVFSGVSLQAQAATSFFDMINKTSTFAGVGTADFGLVGAGSSASGDTVFTAMGGGTTATFKDGAIYTTNSGGVTARPPGSSGGFWSIGISPAAQVGPGMVSFTNAVKYYGFLWGSPDAYNNVVFSLLNDGGGTSSVTVNGAGSPLPGNGNQSYSAYLNFFAGANETITGVTFASSRNAFETDNHAFSVSAVPEPGTYAMMLAGLALVGTIARRRKANQA